MRKKDFNKDSKALLPRDFVYVYIVLLSLSQFCSFNLELTFTCQFSKKLKLHTHAKKKTSLV